MLIFPGMHASAGSVPCGKLRPCCGRCRGPHVASGEVAAQARTWRTRGRAHIHLARMSVSCDADARTHAPEIGVIDDGCFENMDGQARVAGWQPVCLRRARERREKGGGWEGGNNEQRTGCRQAGRQRVRARERKRRRESAQTQEKIISKQGQTRAKLLCHCQETLGMERGCMCAVRA